MNGKKSGGLRAVLLEQNPRDGKLLLDRLESPELAADVVVVRDESRFVEALLAHAPDIVVAGPSVPGVGSLFALRSIQEHLPGTPFVFVARAFTAKAAECLKGGAVDCLLTSDLDRLESVVRSAFDQRAPLRTLTARQREVFRLLALGRSTRQIGESLGVSVKTVETHRADVMKRLGIRDLAGLVRYAVGIGLVSTGL